MKQLFKNIIFTVFFILFIFNLTINILITNAFAGAVSLDKTYVLLEGNKRSDQIIAFNSSNETSTYKLSLVNYKQNPDGSYTAVTEENENLLFAQDYISFGPRTFTLKPGETKIVRINKKVMAEVATGEYISHLLLAEQEQAEAQTFGASNEANKQKAESGVSFQINALFYVSFPIVVRNGVLEGSSKMGTIKIDREKDSLEAAVKIERSGNKSARNDIVIKNGKTIVGRVDKVNTFTSTNYRIVKIKLANNEKDINKLIKDIGDKKLTIDLLDSNTSKLIETKILTLNANQD
jgi:P pilus assembly chaperone PapD